MRAVKDGLPAPYRKGEESERPRLTAAVLLTSSTRPQERVRTPKIEDRSSQRSNEIDAMKLEYILFEFHGPNTTHWNTAPNLSV